MKAFKYTLVAFVATVTAVSASACTEVETGTPEEVQLSNLDSEGVEYTKDLEPTSSTKDDVQNANGAGQCCYGRCDNGYTFRNIDLTSGCRDYVVAVCHARGYAFNPSGDAYWGSCY